MAETYEDWHARIKREYRESEEGQRKQAEEDHYFSDLDRYRNTSLTPEMQQFNDIAARNARQQGG